MDYNIIFSDLQKFHEQLLDIFEIYFNELNKDNKGKLIKIQNNSNWKKELKNYLEQAKEKLGKNQYRAEKIIEKIKENKTNNNENEFIFILDITELLYEIYYCIINGEIGKKSSKRINHKMVNYIYKELIQIIRLIYFKFKEKKNLSTEMLLRFYEDQFFLIKNMKPTFKDIKLNNYAEKQLKIRILMYTNQNLNSENSFELDPLKEEFIKYDLDNNTDKQINNDFYIQNKNKDVIKSMFEFTPFKLTNFNFANQKNDEDKKDENETKNNEDKKYPNDSSFDDDFEISYNSFSNISSISNEEDDK